MKTCLETEEQGIFEIANSAIEGYQMVPQKNRSWQILAASQNLESVFYKSQSLIFARFVFTFIEC